MNVSHTMGPKTTPELSGIESMDVNPEEYLKDMHRNNANWYDLLAVSGVFLGMYFDEKLPGTTFPWLPKLYTADDDLYPKLSAIAETVRPDSDFRLGNVSPLPGIGNYRELTTLKGGRYLLTCLYEEGLPCVGVKMPSESRNETYPEMSRVLRPDKGYTVEYSEPKHLPPNPRIKFIVVPNS